MHCSQRPAVSRLIRVIGAGLRSPAGQPRRRPAAGNAARNRARPRAPGAPAAYRGSARSASRARQPPAAGRPRPVSEYRRAPALAPCQWPLYSRGGRRRWSPRAADCSEGGRPAAFGTVTVMIVHDSRPAAPGGAGPAAPGGAGQRRSEARSWAARHVPPRGARRCRTPRGARAGGHGAQRGRTAPCLAHVRRPATPCSCADARMCGARPCAMRAVCASARALACLRHRGRNSRCRDSGAPLRRESARRVPARVVVACPWGVHCPSPWGVQWPRGVHCTWSTVRVIFALKRRS